MAPLPIGCILWPPYEYINVNLNLRLNNISFFPWCSTSQVRKNYYTTKAELILKRALTWYEILMMKNVDISIDSRVMANRFKHLKECDSSISRIIINQLLYLQNNKWKTFHVSRDQCSAGCENSYSFIKCMGILWALLKFFVYTKCIFFLPSHLWNFWSSCSTVDDEHEIQCNRWLISFLINFTSFKTTHSIFSSEFNRSNLQYGIKEENSFSPE